MMAGKKPVPKAPVLSEDPVQVVVNGLVEVASSMKAIAEERTKQVTIVSQTQVQVEQIRATKELLLTYLDRSFDERKANFQSLFNALDRAILEDNPEVAASTLGAVVALAQSSPFKDLQDFSSTQAALRERGKKWVF